MSTHRRSIEAILQLPFPSSRRTTDTTGIEVKKQVRYVSAETVQVGKTKVSLLVRRRTGRENAGPTE